MCDPGITEIRRLQGLVEGKTASEVTQETIASDRGLPGRIFVVTVQKGVSREPPCSRDFKRAARPDSLLRSARLPPL